jgi:lysophospholipase L1-like esterase
MAILRFSIFLTLPLVLALGGLAQPQLPILQNKRILILGDSITQNGTYVSFVSYFLQKRNPDFNYDIISIGLGSETVAGTSEADHPFPRPCVHTRLDEALEKIRPEIVFACYGMNDGIYHPLNGERFLQYQRGIETLIDKVAAIEAEILLMTPPLFDASAKEKLSPGGSSYYSYKSPYENYNDVLRTYGEWILLTDLPVVAKVDLNTPMLEYNQARRKTDPEFHLANDGVHPGELGHLIMALAILDSLGTSIEGDPPEILAETIADPLFAKIRDRRELRSKGWLEYIGYERRERVKTDSVDEVELKAAELQTAIDQLRRGRHL